MKNLWKETICDLAENGKTWDDVVGICCDDFQITKAQFEELANRQYDNGYGGAEVAQDLMIVGADFWLERHEYDGSEWWEYKQRPNLAEKPFVSVDRLIRDCEHYRSYTLKSLNEDEE
jgi:hypothetical protein